MSSNKILVVGGGISGITCAIEIAETGHEVTLIEKLPYLGGRVAQISMYFPKMCPPYCGLEINFQRIRKNPRIEVLCETSVSEVSGTKGDFNVKLSTKPETITRSCTACGICVDVCPVERNNAFNHNFNKTKAIYLPHEMAFPFKYTIDNDVCKGEVCGECVKICPYSAINLKAEETEITRNFASIIYATGWNPYPVENVEYLNYKNFEDVISNVEMERLMAKNGPTKGQIQKPSDKSAPENVVFVQCAGSRDENYLPYCSGVCCSASLKQAQVFLEQNPKGKATIFYIDIRVAGRNEDFLNKAKTNERLKLVKGKVAKIEKNNTKIQIIAENINESKKETIEADLVVLASGIMPVSDGLLPINDYGFAQKNQLMDGIYTAGTINKPMDVSASVKDATGKALLALQGDATLE